MSLPDSPTLRAMIDAATPGSWRRAYHGTHEVEADPDQRIADCGTVDRARADAAIMALAKESAEEVIRFRTGAQITGHKSDLSDTIVMIAFARDQECDPKKRAHLSTALSKLEAAETLLDECLEVLS